MIIVNGLRTLAWYDFWCPSSPLADFITYCDIHGIGMNRCTSVAELVVHNDWVWPRSWHAKYPRLRNIDVPILTQVDDKLTWLNLSMEETRFFVASVWECIRPRAELVEWYNIVWFPLMIHRHAINLWLILKRKLRTQDKFECGTMQIRMWDDDNHLVTLTCSLCGLQHDTHEHLFFECRYSWQMWEILRSMNGFRTLPCTLNDIVSFLKDIAKSKSIRSVVSKLVFAAACYFIWQERNKRLFTKNRRTVGQLVDIITSTVRLKLVTCRFKKTHNVNMMLRLWEVPSSRIYGYFTHCWFAFGEDCWKWRVILVT